MNNKVNIKDILLDIERPARYLGNELNTYHKDTSNKDLVRFGFSCVARKAIRKVTFPSFPLFFH